jgi:hypothetical protein
MFQLLIAAVMAFNFFLPHAGASVPPISAGICETDCAAGDEAASHSHAGHSHEDGADAGSIAKLHNPADHSHEVPATVPALADSAKPVRQPVERISADSLTLAALGDLHRPPRRVRAV